MYNIGVIPMPADFKYREVFLKGRLEAAKEMGGERRAHDGGAIGEHHKVSTEKESPLGTLCRVLQLQRTAGSVAGVSKRFVTFGLAKAVHCFECLKRVHHLTADLEVVGVVTLQTQRNGWDSAHIGCDIVPHHTIATGYRLH